MLADRGIAVIEHSPVSEVEAGAVVCETGKRITFDELIWVTQAGAASWLADTGLALDEGGFIKIDPTLRSISADNVFAVGDVAANVTYPRPKAGVFAVRQGPPLADNLRRALAGQALVPFKPQTQIPVAHLHRRPMCHRLARRPRCEGQDALASQGLDRPAVDAAIPGAAADGRCRGRRSDEHRQDRDPLGALRTEPMRCGGCGAKVGATTLSRVMARLAPRSNSSIKVGLDLADDAAVVTPPEGKLLVQTVDFFRAFVDDPYVFGRIAANHALGDIYAMGAEPLTALATATVPYGPEEKVEEDLYQMLRGGLDVLEEAGAVLVGGHSGEAAELALGFTINGAVDPNRILRKSGMRAGDRLILTKPLGTGALFAAEMRGKAKGAWIDAALGVMQQSSRDAARALREAGATACTDVTGFGLVGHLVEMLRASRVDATLCIDAMPALEGAIETLAAGISSSLAPENLRLRSRDPRSRRGGQDCRYSRCCSILKPRAVSWHRSRRPMPSACVAELRRLGYGQACVVGEVLAMAGDEPSIALKERETI